MEDGVFHRPAVAGILEDRFVEARLHVDYPRNMQREIEMVGSNAQPIYVVMDPHDESLHARFEGAVGPGQTQQDFIDFLETGWRSARPSTAKVGEASADGSE